MKSRYAKKIALMAASAACSLLFSASTHAQETIKVGLMLTYSGPLGLGGQMADEAVKLFQQKNGTTVNGKKIVIIKRDTTGPNPEVVKRLTQELIVREKVNVIIGPDFTPNVLAVAQLVTEAKVPTIQIGSATGGIVGEKSPYYLRTFYTIPQLTKPIAEWTIKNGIKKTYMLVADFGPGLDTLENFSKAYTEGGGKIAGVSKISLSNPEFSSYLQRIKDSKPDAVFVFLPFGALVPQFLKAYADAGLQDGKIKLLGTADLTDESMLEASGNTALNIITSGPYSTYHQSELNNRVVNDYAASAGKLGRFNSYNVATWDALRLIYDGVKAQGDAKFDGDKFMTFAKGRTFESPRGQINIDKTTGDINQTIYIRRVERKGAMLQNVEISSTPNVPAK